MKRGERKNSHTRSLWSPPTILTLRMCSSSSSCSNLSVLVVAGRPDLTFTSLTLPIPRSPSMIHLLTKGLYFWGWSNLLTRDHTWQEKKLGVRSISFFLNEMHVRYNIDTKPKFQLIIKKRNEIADVKILMFCICLVFLEISQQKT